MQTHPQNSVLGPMRPGFGLLFWWTAAAIIGWLIQSYAPPVMIIFIRGIQGVTSLGGLLDVALALALYGTAGLVSGLLQWLVIRRYFALSAWWIVITCVTWTVALLGAIVIQTAVGNSFMLDGNVNLGLTGGYLIGITQWIILRRCVSHAGLWILANILGWTAALLPAIAIGVGSHLSGFPVLITNPNTITSLGQLLAILYLGFRDVGAGVIVGGITGIALIWLLRQPGDPHFNARLP